MGKRRSGGIMVSDCSAGNWFAARKLNRERRALGPPSADLL